MERHAHTYLANDRVKWEAFANVITSQMEKMHGVQLGKGTLTSQQLCPMEVV
jgi:hypothetical protein